MFEIPGPPERWIVRGGMPAEVVRDMPSFEAEDGGLHVYDLVVVQMSLTRGTMLFSRWYGTAALIADEGMVPLHHNPSAWWNWRPRIYERALLGGWTWLGSQQELQWRHGLSLVMRMDAREQLLAVLDSLIEKVGEEKLREKVGDDDYRRMLELRREYEGDVVVRDADHGPDTSMFDAEDRARDLLLEFLNPQQRIEYAADHSFRVVGAKTGNHYRIRHGNGFCIIDRVTGEETVSYCLHPEGWIPHDDVMLSTKFALEDEQLEQDCLENARQTILKTREKRTRDLVYAADMEKELMQEWS